MGPVLRWGLRWGCCRWAWGGCVWSCQELSQAPRGPTGGRPVSYSGCPHTPGIGSGHTGAIADLTQVKRGAVVLGCRPRMFALTGPLSSVPHRAAPSQGQTESGTGLGEAVPGKH